MNKKAVFLAVIGFYNFTSLNAKAEAYVGVDLIGVRADHHYAGKEENLGSNGHTTTSFIVPNDRSKRGHDIGIGFNLGSKLYSGDAFFATELFYDYLNSKTKDFFATQPNVTPGGPTYGKDRLVLNQRYGVKFNAGYRIHKNLDIFGTVGLGKADFAVEYKSEGNQFKADDISPIYGFGLLYDLKENLSVKAAYDYQALKMQYVLPGPADNITLQTLRVGLIYSF